MGHHDPSGRVVQHLANIILTQFSGNLGYY